jgi:hypothetical protein
VSSGRVSLSRPGRRRTVQSARCSHRWTGTQFRPRTSGSQRASRWSWRAAAPMKLAAHRPPRRDRAARRGTRQQSVWRAVGVELLQPASWGWPARLFEPACAGCGREENRWAPGLVGGCRGNHIKHHRSEEIALRNRCNFSSFGVGGGLKAAFCRLLPSECRWLQRCHCGSL